MTAWYEDSGGNVDEMETSLDRHSAPTTRYGTDAGFAGSICGRS
jgi:hypothetical protein